MDAMNTLDRNAIRTLCNETIRPHALEWDCNEEFPESILTILAEAGFFGCIIPASHGGLGWSFSDYCFLIEEIASADPSLALMVGSHNSLCTRHVLQFGNEAQKAYYLPLLASGKWIGSWSLTEPEAGSDAAALQTRAVRSDLGWVLNGVKRFTTNAAFSNLNIVLATTDGSRMGITAFLVHSDNSGRILGERIRTMGLKASQTYQITFRDCALPSEALLGEEGRGLASAIKILDGGRLSMAAWALGVARELTKTLSNMLRLVSSSAST